MNKLCVLNNLRVFSSVLLPQIKRNHQIKENHCEYVIYREIWNIVLGMLHKGVSEKVGSRCVKGNESLLLSSCCLFASFDSSNILVVHSCGLSKDVILVRRLE